MGMFTQVVVVILSLFLSWRIFSQLKANPELITKQKVSQSIKTLGILALLLIVLVTVMVQLVR